MLPPAQNTHTLHDPIDCTYGAEHARARGVEDYLGVHIGLDGGGDVSDVMREEAGIWGDDLNTCMEYRIRRDDWNMGTPAAFARRARRRRMVMNVATSAPVVGASVLNRSRRSGVCYVGLTHCVGADIDCRQ